jgi:hypothetical protein
MAIEFGPVPAAKGEPATGVKVPVTASSANGGYANGMEGKFQVTRSDKKAR